MAIFKGRNGKLKVVAPDPTPQVGGYSATSQEDIGQIASWRLQAGPDTEEVTEFSDEWAEFCATVKRWSGSAEGYFSPADGAAPNHTEIMGMLITGMTSSLEGSGDQEGQLTGQFFIDDNAGGGAKLCLFGNIIPSFEITGSVQGIFLVSFTFQGSGALTYTAVGT